VKNGETDKACEYVPANGVFSEFINLADFEKLMHLSLMTKNPGDLYDICEISEGLEFALIKAAKSSESYAEMLEKLKSKTVTDAKIRRMALFAFFGVTKEFMITDVPYTYVLSMSDSEEAKTLMRICRKQKEITVAQKINALKKDGFSEFLYNLSRNAEKILELSTKNTD
jgi:predicted nucleotidyltransferase